MNKTQLTQTIVRKNGLTEAVVSAVVDSCFETITEQLVVGENVSIQNFGVFKVVGRSDIKGEPSKARQKRYASFQAGKGLNEKLCETGKE